MVRVMDLKKIFIYMVLVLLLSAAALYMHDLAGQEDEMADSLLRLHVIANSDAPGDQQAKLEVRDRIIRELGDEIRVMDSKQQVIDFIRNNKGRIEQIARDQLKSSGKNYDVKAETGSFVFPTKLYGNLALPAGEYDALRVVLGEGKGANWWCVMFPPLCFVDDSSVAFARDQERVREMLEQEEYRILAESGSRDRIPVRLRFKVIELINRSRIKMAEVLGRK